MVGKYPVVVKSGLGSVTTIWVIDVRTVIGSLLLSVVGIFFVFSKCPYAGLFACSPGVSLE